MSETATAPEAPTTICLGTRASALARWQTGHVVELLAAAWPALSLEVTVDVMATQGDRELGVPLPLIGGKGLFTAELESALGTRAIDLAVHSLKDLPTTDVPGLTVGAIPRRTNPADVLVSRRGHTLETLPRGAVVGTSSRRRAAQLLALRPDLRLADLRGNVDTRLRKALNPAGQYDAIILAHAGLERLGRLHVVSQVLSLELMLPAPGQGALGVQCRDEVAWLHLLAPLADPETAVATTAERAFLAGLGGGCAMPVSAHAHLDIGRGLLRLRGRVSALDGSARVDVSGVCPSVGDLHTDSRAARQLGTELAQAALAKGAEALLEVAA